MWCKGKVKQFLQHFSAQIKKQLFGDVTSRLPHSHSFVEASMGCLSCGISQSAICCRCWLIACALPASAVHPSAIDAISFTLASPLMTSLAARMEIGNGNLLTPSLKSFEKLPFFSLMLPVSATNTVGLVWNGSGAIHTFKYAPPPLLIFLPRLSPWLFPPTLSFSSTLDQPLDSALCVTRSSGSFRTSISQVCSQL